VKREHDTNFMNLATEENIKLCEVFDSFGDVPCEKCKKITKHKIQQSFQFPDTNKFIIARLNNFNNQMKRLTNYITDYDADKILFPNESNILYKIQSAIEHLGDSPNSGHYVIWTRHGDGWKRISDDESRNSLDKEISENLQKFCLLFLKKI
jgi:hypothetical protein